MFDLSGKLALVTGSSNGIGRAIALKLAEAGADVIVHYRSDIKSAKEVFQKITSMGRMSDTVSGDMRDPEKIREMFSYIEEKYGRLDIMVNNAAVLTRIPLLEMTAEDWDMLMETNARGYFLCTKYAALLMKKQNRGRIINISSISQYQAAVNRTHYCATKGAIGMLTKGAALELAPYGITVNAILPGSIHTKFNNDVLSQPEYYKNTLSGIPAGRLGRPDDIAGAAVMLASDEAEFTSGAEIVIDGAMTV